MSITTADELKTALANWAKRTDLTARMDEFIVLAEARINRDLRVSGMEETFASTALASGAVANPTGFLAWKELRYDGSPSYTLEPKPLEWIRNQADEASPPLYFAISKTSTICAPQSGNVKGTYYEALDSLTANPANWLLTASPDLYLFACLEQIAIYGWDDAAEQRWGSRASGLIQAINSADAGNRINGGPLTARAR
jgi:hypothetical protein